MIKNFKQFLNENDDFDDIGDDMEEEDPIHDSESEVALTRAINAWKEIERGTQKLNSIYDDHEILNEFSENLPIPISVDEWYMEVRDYIKFLEDSLERVKINKKQEERGAILRPVWPRDPDSDLF